MVFSKRLILLVTILITFSFTIAGCKQSNPEITTSIAIDKITQEEYDKIDDSSKPEGVTINDLRKLLINVKITNSKKAEERKITIPDLFIIDKIDGVRTTGGTTYERNNVGTEDTAESMAYIIFDIRGLSEQDLRDLYKESEIYISYKPKNGNLVEKSISVGDNLKFNN
ncbi:MAG TPA: hypothetical protein GXX36_11820 [Clostridiaceae bacterium]|nr:hypothetical protein [Clostridiaceae bacterium]